MEGVDRWVLFPIYFKFTSCHFRVVQRKLVLVLPRMFSPGSANFQRHNNVHSAMEGLLLTASGVMFQLCKALRTLEEIEHSVLFPP